MALHPEFPLDPYAILDPAMRWRPDLEQQGLFDESKLTAPLVEAVREGVAAWRAAGYAGASETSRHLLHYWFAETHPVTAADGSLASFQWYFAQREAVESAIWLYEVQQARHPQKMMEYDKHGIIQRRMFKQDWPRYVLKLATGSGKTKVISLLIVWAYFHKQYETGSPLSTNFLLVAPNIIVLERLKHDFEGLRIFHNDPLLPPPGYAGRDWNLQMNVHIQDQIGSTDGAGNLFLTNIHRVYAARQRDDNDLSTTFLGPRPTKKTNESYVDLGAIVRSIPDLVIINDEAHHIHDDSMCWFKNIQDIAARLRQKGSDLAVQFDLTATPKHNDGSIFVETVSDYPLVEAIHQCVVKKPVLPDAESRSKLGMITSNDYAEEHQDYLNLGYLEWKKAQERVSPSGRKAVLFIMTDTTDHADEVGGFLRKSYPEFEGDEAVLVIHTKANGELSETSANEKELRRLRERSNDLDKTGDKCVVVVSVMMLREGWDVQSVCTIVGLRAYTSTSKILPEQTLGRGLRLMFRNEPPEGGPEEVSVIGVKAFMDFVEEIKAEGVELNYVPMGRATRPKAPSVVQVAPDHSGPLDPLDIELPVLAPRIYYDYASLEQLDPASQPHRKLPLKHYAADAEREIVFVHTIEDNQFSHKTTLDANQPTDYRNVVGFFARTIMDDARLDNSHYPTIYGKVKAFVQHDLFISPVDLDQLDTLRNLAEFEAGQLLRKTFADAIKGLVVRERATTVITRSFRLSQVKPYQINGKDWFAPTKSIFDKVACDNAYELALAKILDESDEIISFARNPARTGFGIEYLHSTDGIPNYYPDFMVKQTEADIWLVEFKGREDDDDKQKKARLEQWCADATALVSGACRYHPLFIRQNDWIMYPPSSFSEMVKLGV